MGAKKLKYVLIADSSGELDASALIYSGPCVITSVEVITDGTNGALLKLHNAITSETCAATNKRREVGVAGNAGTAAIPNYGGMNWVHPVRCDTGIYAILSGTGATYIVDYAKVE